MIEQKKHEMPTQSPDVRARNFDEVALGYDEKTAAAEAKRCLNCKNKPCVNGCPVGVDIPGFIGSLKNGDVDGAYSIIRKASALPAVCGRVCPQETQCECKCTLGIKHEPVGIGRLERFVADRHNARHDAKIEKPQSNGKRVAIVGSGPAGLTCAGELARLGYAVTIFEALHVAGGVLVYGIPEFRLPKAIVEKEVEGLKALGVRIETNVVVGKTLTVDELFGDGFSAVFIGSGAGLPKFMGIDGEALSGVLSANEFLTRINLMKAYKPDGSTPVRRTERVVVVGGGNVAMDAARSAKRLGSNVVVVYRRTENELPARREEVEHAKEEGVEFLFLTNPVRLVGNDERNVAKIICQRMGLSEPDGSGRARPVPIPNSEFELTADCVIMALGTSPNPLIRNTTDGLDVHDWGGIVADADGRTSRDGVFAGGDAVTGAATVILAMGAGKTAARSIDEYLKDK